MKALLVTFLTLYSFVSLAQTYKLDTSGSKITYVGKKVTGEHTGTVAVKSGNLVFKDDKLAGGQIVADMNTINSTDITNEEYNQKYVKHMKSEDFFNTEKFPEAKVVIKNSKKTNKGLEVEGELTMLGKTNPISFIVTDLKKTDSSVKGKSDLKINRTRWGLKYGSGSFFKGLGDKAIDDEFTLSVELMAKK